MNKLNNEQQKQDYINNRARDLIPIFKELIPKDVESCLDIGSRKAIKKSFMADLFNEYACLDIEDADIIQNLDISEEIKLKSNSVDLVIMSNILEHLTDPLPIALEGNRIAKKYLIIGLPNEYPLDERLLILCGIYNDKIHSLGHKHRMSLKSNEEFVNAIWGNYKKKIYKSQFIGARYVPNSIKKFLIGFFPSLFVGEVYYQVSKIRSPQKLEALEKELNLAKKW